MSGGVDSTLTAKLLLEQGYDVYGAMADKKYFNHKFFTPFYAWMRREMPYCSGFSKDGEILHIPSNYAKYSITQPS